MRHQHARRRDPLLGMFLLRTDDAGDPGPVMARIAGQLYALLFSNAARAAAARDGLGVAARPFYICEANRERVAVELAAAGARGFIVDFDPVSRGFRNAGELVPGVSSLQGAPSSVAP